MLCSDLAVNTLFVFGGWGSKLYKSRKPGLSSSDLWTLFSLCINSTFDLPPTVLAGKDSQIYIKFKKKK